MTGRIWPALPRLGKSNTIASPPRAPLLDALVDAAISIAQANGIDRAGHVRDKLTWLAGYAAETVRALVELA